VLPARPQTRARWIGAALAAAALGVAGCQPVTIGSGGSAGAGGGSKGAAATATSAKAARTGSLVTEPASGFSRVYQLISGAKHSVDMTMYELADTTAEHDLAADARRGVRVRVILDEREKSENSSAYSYLSARKVKVTWSSTRFEYTHQKTLVVDHATAVIMTANLTSRYYSTSRDFLVVDSRRADVNAIERVFGADFAHRAIKPGDGKDLVWSPGSQAQLLAVINGAKRSLRIYSEEMGDSTVEDALIAAAKRGVSVQVCGENSDGEYDSDFARLHRGGVKISYYDSPDGFYIHGKVIEADYGTKRARVFIGSENFSSTSLSRNRELGLITSAHPILASIARSFATDFRQGKHVS
jgi:cardiolipin synthase A/B